ncbi:TPA: hypothetical protein ENX78_13465 [Candidatus Poribacteria bacterium]|nr:hypothetical protein [Candidatus Poribacteria bacterium]
MTRFRLTLTAPTEYSVQTFDDDYSIWTETDDSKTESVRYVYDPIQESVMKVKGKVWSLGDQYTLGDNLYLDDSPLGRNEGVYQDFAVTSGVKYAFACIYRVELDKIKLIFYDQTNESLISDFDLYGSTWKSFETTITIPDGCETLRVKFLQSDNSHSGPFYIDNISLNGNILLSDPDSYSRTPVRIGSFHQTLSGRRIYDLRAIHYDFKLQWNYFDTAQYENFREIFYSNELLYFDDGNVPPLIERETIYNNETYNFSNISCPSSTHKAYTSCSNLTPLNMNDFETTEFSTSDYQAISTDDNDYKETSDPNSGQYIYNKFLIKSSITTEAVQRFSVKIVAESNDNSPDNVDGCILYAWDGNNWVELTRTSNSSKNELIYSTAEPLIAKRFISQSDGYIRLLLRSMNSRNGSDSLNLRVYYVEVEINEDLDSIVRLSHKAILDENGDVIYVKNITKGTTLSLNLDYTVAIDRRSIEVINQDSGDIIEVKYNRYFEVTFSSIPEEWLSGDLEGERTRRVEVTLRTLAESK